jgi:hypothetical protein
MIGMYSLRKYNLIFFSCHVFAILIYLRPRFTIKNSDLRHNKG